MKKDLIFVGRTKIKREEEVEACVDEPRSLLSCAPASCRNVWAPCSSSSLYFIQQQTSEKKPSNSSKKKIRMTSLALQKLDVKDLVCLPLYRKLSPGQALTGPAPTLSPSRTQRLLGTRPRGLPPAQATPPPLRALKGLKSLNLSHTRITQRRAP